MSKIDHKENNPQWLLFIIQICMGIINLLGIMSITQSKIEWKSYLKIFVNTYDIYISRPVWEVIQDISIYLEISFQIDMSWMPYWAADYIIINSAFFLGLSVSFSKIMRISLLKIIFLLIINFILEIKKNIKDDIFSLVEMFFGIFFAIICIYLFSPVILVLSFIVIPATVFEYHTKTIAMVVGAIIGISA